MRLMPPVIGICVLGLTVLAACSRSPAGCEILEGLPSLQSVQLGNGYRVDPYIAAAAKLQALGKEEAVEILRIAAQRREYDEEMAVIALCQMLFTAKPGGKMRVAMLGGPLMIGSSSIEDWPRIPIEVVDGVPFLTTRGFILAGRPESSTSYLKYCLSECQWLSAKFKPKSAPEKTAAFEKLINSPHWKVPPDEDDKQFLLQQLAEVNGK